MGNPMQAGEDRGGMEFHGSNAQHGELMGVQRTKFDGGSVRSCMHACVPHMCMWMLAPHAHTGQN